MRLWDRQLWPYMCGKHLGAMWNEALIMYRSISQNRRGWRRHPETVAYEECPEQLWQLILDLQAFRHSKNLKADIPDDLHLMVKGGEYRPYKTVQQQISDLTKKQCGCNIAELTAATPERI